VGTEADSKLIVSWYAGNWDADEALVFMKDLASRIKVRVQHTTEGYMGYRDAVDTAFRLNVDYTQLVKIYSNKKGEETEDNQTKRHCQYKGGRKEIHSGEPNETFISPATLKDRTSQLERTSGDLRGRRLSSQKVPE
jgi:plasmid stabilization system protein ParE